MATPWKTLWAYYRQVARLQAERDLREINLLAASQDGKAYTQIVGALRNQAGQSKQKAAVTSRPLNPELYVAAMNRNKKTQGSARLAEPGSLRAKLEGKRMTLNAD